MEFVCRSLVLFAKDLSLFFSLDALVPDSLPPQILSQQLLQLTLCVSTSRLLLILIAVEIIEHLGLIHLVKLARAARRYKFVGFCSGFWC